MQPSLYERHRSQFATPPLRSVAGWGANYVAKPAEAKEHFWRALRLSPLDPERAYCLSGLAYAHLMQGEYKEAFAAGTRAVSENPGRATQYRTVIVALHCLDRREELAGSVAAYRGAIPEGARVFAKRVSALYADQKFAATVIGALRAAGLPRVTWFEEAIRADLTILALPACSQG